MPERSASGVRALVLTRYGARAAGSRVRFLQYVPRLAALGIACEVCPFFDDAYVERMYAGRPRGVLGVAASFARRAAALLAAGRHDLVWLEEELFPFLPAAAERLLARRGVPLVLDCDDALFHRYDRHRSRAVRTLLGRKIDRVMASARLVLAGNAYLATRAAAAGAPWVEVLPTVVDPARYPVRAHGGGAEARRAIAAGERDAEGGGRDAAAGAGDADGGARDTDGRLVVGWIGTPRTARYLELLRPALEPLVAAGLARVLVIGGGERALAGLPAVERRPWSEATEARDLASADVGVMPLPDEPFERGKCGYKLIQAMAAGLPVVASPVGVNADLVQDGTNGYLVRGAADWRAALERLALDPTLRARLGAAGRRLVELRYSLDHAAPRLATLLRRAAGASAPFGAPRRASEGSRAA